jgi:uncharacterized membrane protein YsdA (DUF1294 family)
MPSKRELTQRAVVGSLGAGLVVAAALIAAFGVSVLVAYVLGLGLSTFLIYGYDKLRARRGGRRVPEAALLALALIGGALGGWAGMLIWRHKTRHARFWIAQVIGTIVIAVALVLGAGTARAQALAVAASTHPLAAGDAHERPTLRACSGFA